jgi:predicted component of type VI protein secretion system
VIKCPACERSNTDNALICAYCGTPLVDLEITHSTRSLGDTDYEEGVPKWGSARFGMGMNLVLTAVEANKPFTFDAGKVEVLTIGRSDPKSPEVPDIDLTAIKGHESGVSRKHAIILRRDGALHIVDNGSANGTFLNGQRLVAQQPRVLRDGDDLRLGHMVVRVRFVKQGAPAAAPPPRRKAATDEAITTPPVPVVPSPSTATPSIADADLQTVPSMATPDVIVEPQPTPPPAPPAAKEPLPTVVFSPDESPAVTRQLDESRLPKGKDARTGTDRATREMSIQPAQPAGEAAAKDSDANEAAAKDVATESATQDEAAAKGIAGTRDDEEAKQDDAAAKGVAGTGPDA